MQTRVRNVSQSDSAMILLLGRSEMLAPVSVASQRKRASERLVNFSPVLPLANYCGLIAFHLLSLSVSRHPRHIHGNKEILMCKCVISRHTCTHRRTDRCLTSSIFHYINNKKKFVNEVKRSQAACSKNSEMYGKYLFSNSNSINM